MGCDDRYEVSATETERAIREDRIKEVRLNKTKLFLLELKKRFLSNKPMPDFLKPWDKLPKGPVISKRELAELRTATVTAKSSGTGTLSIEVDILRRLVQTIEYLKSKQGIGHIKELPAIGEDVICDSNGWDQFPGTVIAHLPRGVVMAYEPGFPDGDGGTRGKVHVLHGSLDNLNIVKLIRLIRSKTR